MYNSEELVRPLEVWIRRYNSTDREEDAISDETMRI